MNLEDAKEQITAAFESLLDIGNEQAAGLIPSSLTAGKVYEAFVLSFFCGLLVGTGCALTLRHGNKLVLKSSHGPINRNYPWIEVTRGGELIAEIFTDIEFLALSFSTKNSTSPPTQGDYHEIDIAMVSPGASQRPSHTEILAAIECKNTAFNKGLLKEILGVRREMSYLANPPVKSILEFLPAVPADPPSLLIVFSTSAEVENFASPGEVFGIEFIHKPMPLPAVDMDTSD